MQIITEEELQFRFSRTIYGSDIVVERMEAGWQSYAIAHYWGYNVQKFFWWEMQSSSFWIRLFWFKDQKICKEQIKGVPTTAASIIQKFILPITSVLAKFPICIFVITYHIVPAKFNLLFKHKLSSKYLTSCPEYDLNNKVHR